MVKRCFLVITPLGLIRLIGRKYEEVRINYVILDINLIYEE